MRRLLLMAAWIFTLAGCASPDADRVRDYNRIGLDLYRQGQYASARESFQAALNLRPDDPAMLYNVGQCYDRLGDGAKAEQFYSTCLQRDPDHVACHHALAMLLVSERREPEAAQTVHDWLARAPKNSSALAEDGWLWRRQGDLPRAQSRLQEALALNPRDWRALSELAAVYEEQQRPDRALVLYEQSLEENPNQPDVAKHLNDMRLQGVQRPKPE
jgi:Flp pilus assembly protein TadD